MRDKMGITKFTWPLIYLHHVFHTWGFVGPWLRLVFAQASWPLSEIEDHEEQGGHPVGRKDNKIGEVDVQKGLVIVPDRA